MASIAVKKTMVRIGADFCERWKSDVYIKLCYLSQGDGERFFATENALQFAAAFAHRVEGTLHQGCHIGFLHAQKI